jgi:hypothetical protein
MANRPPQQRRKEMTPQEKESLYETILADTEDCFMANGFVWEMYADSVIDFIDNNIVEVITGAIIYQGVLADALEAFNNDRARFNQNWFDKVVA